ncbi:transposase [Streptomyces echinatus]|uniref:transposase n=1 Tax=Streptomyces echinatus TaxID=67293 RepID=UPI0038084CC6
MSTLTPPAQRPVISGDGQYAALWGLLFRDTKALLSQAGLGTGGDRRLPAAGPSGRPNTGPSPVDRARPGLKYHVITDAGGTPFAITLTGGNRHDITQLWDPLADRMKTAAKWRPARKGRLVRGRRMNA